MKKGPQEVLDKKLLELATDGDLVGIRQILQDPDINVNATNERGYTALMLASERSYPEVVRELLEHGAETELSNSYGETALMMASGFFSLGIIPFREGRVEVVRELLNHGADIEEAIIDNALFFAAKRSTSLEIVLELLDRGADADALDVSIFCLAEYLRTHEIVNMLRESLTKKEEQGGGADFGDSEDESDSEEDSTIADEEDRRAEHTAPSSGDSDDEDDGTETSVEGGAGGAEHTAPSSGDSDDEASAPCLPSTAAVILTATVLAVPVVAVALANQDITSLVIWGEEILGNAAEAVGEVLCMLGANGSCGGSLL
ncbi:MAG: ankyrin repeat domain-containing protein [Rickettsiaceae bacterium]|nr:ankyrin repeat domain-containing protein [Rickettsiaceae bacterium]